jgi:protein involved in ribonucleotide reduction
MELDREGGVLLRKANAEVYRTNPFGVLRLPPNATTTEINRRVQELRIRGALQQTGSFPKSTTDVQGRRTIVSQIWQRFMQECEETALDETYLRKITHRLQDPEERLADEFLWFWLIEEKVEEKDRALEALWRGDVSHAIALWREKIESPDDAYSSIAYHNLALIYHLLSLELEIHEEQTKLYELWKAYWYESWQLWLKVINDNNIWNYLAKRAIQLNDPRINREIITSFQKTIILFLTLINAKLALKAFQKNYYSICEFHLKILNNFVESEIKQLVLTYIIDPIIEEIKILLQTAKQRAQNSSPAEAAKWLIENIYHHLDVVSTIFPNHPQNQILRDEIALQIRAWANESIIPGDVSSLEKAIPLLEKAVELSGTESVRERLNKELGEAKRALKVVPILERLGILIKEAQSKIERVNEAEKLLSKIEREGYILLGCYGFLDEAEKLLNEAEPLLRQLDQLFVGASEQQIKDQFHDAVAMTAHALISGAIKAGNMNFKRAKILLERAAKLAMSNNVRLFLQSELKTLNEILARQQQVWTERASGFGCLLVIGLIILIGAISDWWTNRRLETSKTQIASYSSPKLQPSTSKPSTISSKQQASKFSESNIKTREQWIKYLGLEKIAQKYIQGNIKPEGDLDSLLGDLTYEDSTVYLDKEILGDLDRDGYKEKIIIIRINAGGSGIFVYLIVLRNGKFVDVKSLGDRVIINSVSIKKRNIILDMLIHGPNDPMATPTKKVIFKYRLINNRLVSEKDIRKKILKGKIDRLKNELEQGKERLNQLVNYISNLDNQINILKVQIDSLRSKIQIIEQVYSLGFPNEAELESYRALVRQHNELVFQHNDLVRRRNALAKEGRTLIESLRQKAMEHDQLANEYKALLQEE